MSGPPIWAPGESQPSAPPGWYPDTERHGWWRWWDGRVWTEHRAPMGPAEPTGRPATSVLRWFDSSWKRGVDATGAFVPLLATVWLLLAAASVGVFLWLFERPELDTIRDELSLNDRFQPTSATDSVTDDEADAALDALGDLVLVAIPPVVALSLALWVAAGWTVALLVRRIGSERTASGGVLELGGPAVALRRTPAVVAAWLAVVLLGLAIWLVSFAPMAAVILVAVGSDDSFVLPIVIAALFGAIAAIAASLFVIPRIGLATIAAALGGRGLGVVHAWRLTGGRWGATALRLLLMYLIATVAAIPTGILAQGAGLVGGGAVAIAIGVNQAIGMLASSLVYASGGAVFLLDVEALGREDDDQREGLAPPLAPQT